MPRRPAASRLVRGGGQNRDNATSIRKGESFWTTRLFA